MSAPIFLTTIGLFLGAVIVVFAMKYLAMAHAARSAAAGTEAYQDLAQRAVTAQGQIALSLSTVQSELAQVGGRLASVETMLREVG